MSHDHQGLVSVTGVHLPPAIQTAKVAVGLKQPGHEPNTSLHHWHHLSCSRALDKIQPNCIHCLLPKTNTERQTICFERGLACDHECMGVIRTGAVPCSLICLICLTVSLRMAHLSGLTLKLSMLERLAEMSSASSSMYLLSCSLRRLSHLPGRQRD